MKSGQVIEARLGDLTQEQVDAIVNAANSRLQHGGGVADAIATAGGPAIQEASDRWIDEHGSVPAGQVAITTAGDLPCQYVIHAVGPVWHGGGEQEDELLRQAVWNSLIAADSRKLASIALPAISSGIFGFPKDRCARILVQTAVDFCEAHPASSVTDIRFVNKDDATAKLFVDEVEKLDR
jgi:O-acetyl-ADP-ribose deacetylase (regulator of RNase III)